VGTSTEIYDYMKLLFARVGRTYSPISGDEVKKDSVTDVIDYIEKNEGKTFLLRAPLQFEVKKFKDLLKTLKVAGFTRLEVGGNVANIEDLESFGFVPEETMKSISLSIDFLMKTTNNFCKDWQILFKWRFMKDTELVL
jgi:excinuclease ABC subunit A